MNAGIIAAGWGERLGQKHPKALTRVAGRPLIDYALDGLAAAGVRQVTCIINEAAADVPRYVEASGRAMAMDWIIQTTPSSMHSFLIVLERLSRLNDDFYLMTTVDSVCPSGTYAAFARACRLCPKTDVVLGLTDVIEDEKPLRVALNGRPKAAGPVPPAVQTPEAFEITALGNNVTDSPYVTSGFYGVKPSILKEKDAALKNQFTALRQFLGHLLKAGYRFSGVPLPPVVDVDRPRDIPAAEKVLSEK